MSTQFNEEQKGTFKSGKKSHIRSLSKPQGHRHAKKVYTCVNSNSNYHPYMPASRNEYNKPYAVPMFTIPPPPIQNKEQSPLTDVMLKTLIDALQTRAKTDYGFEFEESFLKNMLRQAKRVQ